MFKVGEIVSYGCIFIVDEEMIIVILFIGYVDGYLRLM